LTGTALALNKHATIIAAVDSDGWKDGLHGSWWVGKQYWIDCSIFKATNFDYDSQDAIDF
jgi:hypothetical protein